MKKYKAFISYRRTDSSERAQLVKLAIMEQGYNEDDIFLDLHSIHEGDFPQHIKTALHDTEFFILLLSNDSFKRNLEKGRRGNFPWIAPAPLTKYLSTTFRI